MDAIKNFEELKNHLKNLGKHKRLALANALDSHSLEAVMMSVEEGFIDAYLVGKKEEVARLLEQEFGEKVKKYGDYLHIVDCRGDAAETFSSCDVCACTSFGTMVGVMYPASAYFLRRSSSPRRRTTKSLVSRSMWQLAVPGGGHGITSRFGNCILNVSKALLARKGLQTIETDEISAPASRASFMPYSTFCPVLRAFSSNRISLAGTPAAVMV